MKPEHIFYICAVFAILTAWIMRFNKQMEIQEEQESDNEYQRLMSNIDSAVTFDHINNCEKLFELYTHKIAHLSNYQDIFRKIERAIERKRVSIRAVQNVFDEMKIILN